MSTNDPNRIPWGPTDVNKVPSNYISTDSVTVNSFNTNVIRGSQIYVEQKVSSYEVSGNVGLNTINEFRDKIKEKLMKQMLEHMMNNNYIEFTSQENMADQEVIYRARAYLVPDDQVRLLRTTGSIK